MQDTEVCDWCGKRFNADNALFDLQADPVTRQGRLVTACREAHLQALAGRAHPRSRPLRRRRHRVVARRWVLRRPHAV
jgi:hypothetical protein